MPFIARLKSTGERINAFTYEGNVKVDFAKGDLVCPYCGEELFPRRDHFKSGDIYVRPHFVHPNHTCNTEYEIHEESEAHIALKQSVHDNLMKQFASDGTEALVELEVPVDMDWRARGRIADVMVTYPGGWQEAHEIQLSPISVEEFKERTSDYERSGIEVVWYLGEKNTQNDQVTEWFREYFGGFIVAEVNYAHRDNFNRARRGDLSY